jgi:hypothetical protein
LIYIGAPDLQVQTLAKCLHRNARMRSSRRPSRMVSSTISNPRRPGPLMTNLRCNQLSSRADESSLNSSLRSRSPATEPGSCWTGRPNEVRRIE